MHTPGGWEDPIDERPEDDPVALAFYNLRRSRSPTHAQLWEAINGYAIACGADPGRHVYGNQARMDAVVLVERAVVSMARAAVNES